MINIMKTLTMPILFILPWALMKIYGWEHVVQKTINQPILVSLILLPSILFSLVWAINLIAKSNLRQTK
jgi:hypothetical protein